jgi:hypothetical protein
VNQQQWRASASLHHGYTDITAGLDSEPFDCWQAHSSRGYHAGLRYPIVMDKSINTAMPQEIPDYN